MANEIVTSGQIQLDDGNLQFNRRLSNERYDQSNSGFDWTTQDIGTSNEALNISSDISSAGWAWFRNIDDTNFVEVGVQDANSNFIPFIKLKPGEFAIMRLATSSIYAKADTASIKLEWLVLED